MIPPGVFRVDPWTIVEPALRPDLLAQTETIFALSNGHIGLRGNLDEGEPHEVPGSYLNGFFESLPLPYAEEGYGFLGTADGREIYFHENAVKNGGFSGLTVGSPVHFVEEAGTDGPQATVVVPSDRHSLRR